MSDPNFIILDEEPLPSLVASVAERYSVPVVPRRKEILPADLTDDE